MRVGVFDYEALYLELDRKRATMGMSWERVAEEIAGPRAVGHRISPSTITRTSRGGPMEADGILAMTRWVGRSFADFARTPIPKRRNALLESRRFDTSAIYAAVNEEREAKALTWKEAASQIDGFTPSMLKRLAKRGRMSADQVVSLCAWLERAPEDFTYLAKA